MKVNDQDIFVKINNAVLDLQSSQLTTFEHPLKKLGRLLRHDDLEPVNDRITANVDLDEFLERSPRNRGMAGTGSLRWPEDEVDQLGLQWLLIQKFADNPGELTGFTHDYYNGGRMIMAGIQNFVSQLVIPFVRDYKAYALSNGEHEPRLIPELSKRVFVVHGHDEGARETVARFLEKLGFEPIILHEQANQGRTIIEKVETHGGVSFAVVLLTPDDEGRVSGGDPNPRPRQNVLLELGYFIGRLGRSNVCALKKGDMELPSDFAGVVWEEMDASGGWRLSLARELKAVGHDVDLNKAV
ncbi:MAG: nucleotide-binding protein [Pseudomonadota bacterium]